jgi:hypothetical protein
VLGTAAPADVVEVVEVVEVVDVLVAGVKAVVTVVVEVTEVIVYGILAGDALLAAPTGAAASFGAADAELKSEPASTRLDPAAAITRRDIRIRSLLSSSGEWKMWCDAVLTSRPREQAYAATLRPHRCALTIKIEVLERRTRARRD